MFELTAECRIFFYRWIHDVREISFDNSIWIHIRMWKPAHISLLHLRLFLLLSDEVACFAGPFLRRECLGLSYIYFYGMDNFSLPYIVCYRWRDLSDITTIGSYYGFIRPLYSLFYVFERFHSIHECFYGIIILVFESFSQHIDSDIAYHERAQRAIHL